jgi:catechol 2,3-dioxygenase-like lactoylglutathione lyase family enzyme
MIPLTGLVINSLQHVGIPVTDKETSYKFYSRLGFEKVMEEFFDHEGSKGVCIMMQRGNIMLELYQFPGEALEAIRSRRDGHIDHIAFDVPDIETTFHLMKKNGFQIVEEAPVFLPFWKKGCKYFNVVGPDGERLEFNQVI